MAIIRQRLPIPGPFDIRIGLPRDKGFDPKNLPIWTDHSRTWYLNGKVVGESRQKCRRVESYEGYEN